MSRGRALEVVERVRDRVSSRGDGGGRITMGAADRLGHDLVDDAEAGEVLGGDLHVFAASCALAVSRQRIEAAPSGEITL